MHPGQICASHFVSKKLNTVEPQARCMITGMTMKCGDLVVDWTVLTAGARLANASSKLDTALLRVSALPPQQGTF